MASDIKIVYHNNVFAGSGAPADGDLLTRDNSSHPKDSVYIDRDSGTVYIRKATTLVADTDWQAPSSGGSGGGAVLESYQNSVMAAPVQAYVYRDADDNIYEVYDPAKNNRVSRYSYTYAESIDVFPFDNVAVFNNHIENSKLLGLASDTKIQSCKWKNIIVNNNSHTGTEFKNHNHIGNYGANTPNAAEIYITSNGVTFYKNEFSLGAFIDSPGATSNFENINANQEVNIYCNGYSTTIQHGILGAQSYIWATVNGGGLFDFYLGASAYVDLGNTQYQFIHIGESALLGDYSTDKAFYGATNLTLASRAKVKPDTTHAYFLDDSFFGPSVDLTISENIFRLNICNYPSKDSDPTNTILPDGASGIFKNSTTGDVKLWVNDGGTLKSVTLT